MINEIFLKHFYYLDWHYQWNRNHGIDEDKIREEYDDRVSRRWIIQPVNVIVRADDLVSENAIKNSHNYTKHDLNNQNDS